MSETAILRQLDELQPGDIIQPKGRARLRLVRVAPDTQRPQTALHCETLSDAPILTTITVWNGSQLTVWEPGSVGQTD